VARYLGDTSAWTRCQATPWIAARWAALVELDEIAIAVPIQLELLYAARGRTEYRERRAELNALPQLPLQRSDVDRAADAQASLAERSQHRGPTPVDLMLAAVAERNALTVIHYDRHFDAIARVTGQPTEWLARRGSLD
jgi:predicted nucleic acid-binding protein